MICFTHIVCTPHANGTYAYDRAVNTQKVTELQAALDAERIPLKIGLGCDFHLSYDNILDAKADPSRFSVNGLGYLMVEIPDYGVPRGLAETFYELQLAGLTPILTHPERNPTLQQDQTRLAEWMRGGVLVQVTADSVLGKMGKIAHKMALRSALQALGPLPRHRRPQPHLAPAPPQPSPRHCGKKIRRSLRRIAGHHQPLRGLPWQALPICRRACRSLRRVQGKALVPPNLREAVISYLLRTDN